MIDQARTIRTGEELDVAKLKAYLSAHFHASSTLEVTQFPSGYSNLTYLLAWGNQELVLRRPPFGATVKSGHDMEREYLVLKALKPVYHKVPNPILYCGDTSIIGAPFYIMERVRGVILRNQANREIKLYPSTMQNLSEKLIDNLATIHAIDINQPEIASLGKPEGYVQRQVEGWGKRYKNSQTDDIPQMAQVAAWLEQNRPPEVYISLIHNDYKYDNIVFDSDLYQILAVLDWEMATLGDPLMDLGTTLGYWIEPTDPEPLHLFGLTTLPGNLTREQLVERYAQKSGREVKNVVFYYVFGLFKIAVIVQQIYFRYKKGFTQDERFASLIHVLQACAQTAVKAIETNRIYKL
ncbi:phosphotransferase family protein [Rhodocytophaga aerolata]|uniref:Phosphotransferase family protein n=1 Tax=Rhodocytophaga aerolata TaxID=455078 RepID=A0ABT8QZA9_9BACT|nr:phosphotransferase family protein [Rhodocytophaga aerolata]MDO1445173.1 phosphotransferase family protein [Rhodocytophaga aerolata]